ncbi:MAG: hypothetical protein EOO40_07225, partial [Deltaproteobacteria bacterium]
MANTQKPDSYLDWTDGAANHVAKPAPGVQAMGFGMGQPIPYQIINWLFWRADQWIQFLDGSLNATLMATTLDSSMRLSGGGTLSYVQASGTFAWSAPLYLNIPSIPSQDNTIPAGSVRLSPGQIAYVSANVPFSTTGDVSSGSQNVQNLAYELGIAVGQTVTGANIPANTTVQAVSGTSLTLSQAATGSGSQQNLTFAGVGPLTVSTGTFEGLVPSANTVILARATAQGTAVEVGVNAVQVSLHDGEQKTFLTTGYTGIIRAPAGAALSALSAVYVSPGGNDSGRTLGSIYPADGGSTFYDRRARLLGICTTACAAGDMAHVVTSGVVPNFAGLTPGNPIYLDPQNPGMITQVKGGAGVEVGLALTATA